MNIRRIGMWLLVPAMTLAGTIGAQGDETSSADSQVVRGAGGGAKGRGRDRSGQQLETVIAEVTLLRRDGGSEGNPSGAPVITVRTTEGTELILHVGPPFFRKANDFPIAVGDVLSATGWRETEKSYASIAVRSVKNGDKTLEVRDETGKRLWQRPDPADDGSPFESISGEVIGFGMNAHKQGGSVPDTGTNGVVLIRAPEGEVYGHIGPAAFRREKGLNLSIGAPVTLRAWRVDARMSQRPFVIVRAIVAGDIDLEVRTDRRKPHWKKD